MNRTRRTYGESRLALLHQRRGSLAEIARGLHVDLSVVSRVNDGSRTSRRIRAAIAKRLGLSVREAFPELVPAGAVK
ncbi:MAG: hypothetical protein Q8S13_05420 [Dehalococcoidia bacterium]|nr:hypothetical protein [Dehalococcoidia bacterium]